jgi:hypothetical protein
MTDTPTITPATEDTVLRVYLRLCRVAEGAVCDAYGLSEDQFQDVIRRAFAQLGLWTVPVPEKLADAPDDGRALAYAEWKTICNEFIAENLRARGNLN